MSKAAVLINQVRKAGLQIRVDAGQVRLGGPSELIQQWRPILAPHKAELLALLAANDASIPADLETLIGDAATYWLFDDDDTRLIRETAARDPEGIRLALTTDPLRPFYGTGTVNDTQLGSGA